MMVVVQWVSGMEQIQLVPVYIYIHTSEKVILGVNFSRFVFLVNK